MSGECPMSVRNWCPVVSEKVSEMSGMSDQGQITALCYAYMLIVIMAVQGWALSSVTFTHRNHGKDANPVQYSSHTRP